MQHHHLPGFERERAFSGPVDALFTESLHPKIRGMLDYWRGINRSDRLPGRQHIDPADIPSLLPNVWLIDIERAPHPRARYRLIGTSIVRAFDRDHTGRYLDEVHPDFADSKVWSYMSGVVANAHPDWRFGIPHLNGLGEFVRLERIYLPLATDGLQVDMILALSVFLDRFGVEF